MAPETTDTLSPPLQGHEPPFLEVLGGDCLELIEHAHALRGPFDLVYVDPPYNAGGTRGARKQQGERHQGESAYRDTWGGLDGFLAMIQPRLERMFESLSTRGSLWIHLDHRTVHDVKVLMDRIAGRNRFEGEIVWVPGNGGRRRAGPSITHQTILIYSRSAKFLYQADHPYLREPYAETSQKMHFHRQDETGRRYRERTIGGKTYRYYADVGRRIGSVWSDCPAMRANTPLNREATGYPTQKPEALLERIVAATTERGSSVLDPMCGSGTTLTVARRLGRHAIGIDQSEVAVATSKQRLENVSPSSVI